MPRLRVYDLRTDSVQDFVEGELYEGEFPVGRGVNPGEPSLRAGEVELGPCGVRLKNSRVSGSHGVFFAQEDPDRGCSVFYIDEGSTNKSFYPSPEDMLESGVRYELRDRDSVYIGTGLFRIEVVLGDDTSTQQRPVIGKGGLFSRLFRR